MAGCLVAVAKTLVSMEQSYVSAAFFRHLTKERLQRHQAEQLLADGRPQPLKEKKRRVYAIQRS